MGAKIDLSGQKFGKLSVVREVKGADGTRWECDCDCGNTTKVITGSLRSGNTKSCGCGIGSRKGYDVSSKEYNTWRSIKKRCRLKTYKDYPAYGAAGIDICQEWFDEFQSFLDDMGFAPSADHQVDRIDNNGNYEPNNCRWATRKEQARNRKTSYTWQVKGVFFESAGEASVYYGVSNTTIINWCSGGTSRGRAYPPLADCSRTKRYA